MKRSKTSMVVPLSVLLISAILSTLNPVNCQGSEQKCTPCSETPPPPPPPSPCPPPPSPPPPPKKHPSPPSPASLYCPPPPGAPFIYITGPPGQQLYPIDQDVNYNGAQKSGPILASITILIACGIFGFLGILAF